MNDLLRPTAVRPASWGDFLALPENRSALRAVRSLGHALLGGKRPAVNPLVLHGPPGTGKTLLTTELVRAVAAGPNGLTAQSVSAGDLARGAAADEQPGFADLDFRGCDLLVLEDIHRLPGKEAEAVCELLDHRTARRKPTVVTAPTGPAGLTGLPRKLTSRLAAGLVVQLEPLAASSRRAILERAAAARNVRLTADALDWLAAQTSGMRAALGSLQNLAPVSASSPGPLDRTTVEQVLTESGQPTSNSRSVTAIVKRVAAAFGVTEKDLLGPSRLRTVRTARQVAMYLARTAGGLSLPRVGAAFSRDHTTVLHAVRKVEADEALIGIIRELRSNIV